MSTKHNLSPEEIQLLLKVACCHIAADGKVRQEELAALNDVLRRNGIFYEPTSLQDDVVGICRDAHAKGAGRFAESLKQEVLASRPEVGRLIKVIQDACVVPSNVPQSHAMRKASPAIHSSEDTASSGKHNHDSSVEPEDIGRFLSPPKEFPPSPQPSGDQSDSGCAKVFVVAAIIIFVAIVMAGMWVGDPKPALLFGWLACGVAGYQIGKQKEAALTGLVWGLALGPIGVLISSQFDSRQFCATCGTRLNGRPSICPGCRSRLNSKDKISLDTGIDSPRRDTKFQGPACPHCGGSLPFDAAAKEHHICMHCRCDLFWVDGVVFATGEDAETRRNEQARQQEAQAREQAAAVPQPDAHAGMLVIKSPMVGTFYKASGPDTAPFVKVGDRIGPEKTVCIVEILKVFNEIPSGISGQVVAILVENGAPVEFGQPLIKVDPRA